MTRAARARTVVLAAVLLLVATGCGADTATPDARAATAQAPSSSAPTPPAPATPGPARQGREAPGARVTFTPELLRLPDGSSAPVEPARTRDGVLDVPAEVDRVGWWDGSAQVGDPYGSTVLAGHVDSAEQGLGVLARLRGTAVGDLVVVGGSAGGRDVERTYRVVGTEQVPKTALSASGPALDQRGPHRLVLITCTGDFDPLRRSYEDNLVVTAVPADA